MGAVITGVAGWSYPDWKGVVYPADAGRGFSELRFLSRYVDAVELNMSFYRPPTPAMAARWVEQVAAKPEFLFTAKLWRRFTHERETPWRAGEVAAFHDGLAPLREAGRLGALLMQFPWSFEASPRNRDYLTRLGRTFARYRCVVEVRHASWAGGETLDFLRAEGLNLCNIDQPASRKGLGRTNAVTGPVGYYRFHGRNRAAWFARDAGRDAKYDYLYRPGELTPWANAVRERAGDAEQLFVMNNNHYRGQALVNALQMKSMLSGEKVAAPPLLARAYPVLGEIMLPPNGQRRLF
jgi:uncharacterized protein YecE (DUF72 family)